MIATGQIKAHGHGRDGLGGADFVDGVQLVRCRRCQRRGAAACQEQQTTSADPVSEFELAGTQGSHERFQGKYMGEVYLEPIFRISKGFEFVQSSEKGRFGFGKAKPDDFLVETAAIKGRQGNRSHTNLGGEPLTEVGFTQVFFRHLQF